jgi:hypothetical protein
MPNKEFLEEGSLYRKFKVTELPSTTDTLPKVRLKMADLAAVSHRLAYGVCRKFYTGDQSTSRERAF